MKLFRAILFCTFGCLSILAASCASLFSTHSSAQGADPFAVLSSSDPFQVNPPVHLPEKPQTVNVPKRIIENPPTYAELRSRCIEEGKILVVGVRCEPPSGAWLSVRDAADIWAPGEYYAVIRSKQGQAYLIGTCPKGTSADEIAKNLPAAPDCGCGPECMCFPCRGQCGVNAKPVVRPLMQQSMFFGGGGGGGC